MFLVEDGDEAISRGIIGWGEVLQLGQQGGREHIGYPSGHRCSMDGIVAQRGEEHGAASAGDERRRHTALR